MSIQAKNNALLWERRKQAVDGEGYDPTIDTSPKERDRWAVHTLLKAGQIERQHKDAAEWLWGLMEGACGASSTEAVDCGGRTPEAAHEAALRAAADRVALERAFLALSVAGHGRVAYALFASYREHGRPTVAFLAERLDMETNGCRRRIIDCLRELSDYRDRVDARQQAHKARLDGTHFSEQQFVTI